MAEEHTTAAIAEGPHQPLLALAYGRPPGAQTSRAVGWALEAGLGKGRQPNDHHGHATDEAAAPTRQPHHQLILQHQPLQAPGATDHH